MKSRSGRAFWSVSSGVLGSLATLVLGVLSTPFLLQWLGDERMGAYRIALEWLGYLALLDFGIAAALQTSVAKRLGNHEVNQALVDVRAGMYRFMFVALLQFLLSILLSFLFVFLIRDLSAEVGFELRWGVTVAAISALWIPLNLLRPLLDASQQSYWVNLALATQSTVSIILAIFFAWCGLGLVGQFASVLVGSALYTFTLCIAVLCRYPKVVSAKGLVSSDTFEVAWPMFAFNLLGRVSVLSDSIILGSIVGPVDVVRFYLTQRLMLLAVSQVMAIGNSTWAPLTEMYHRGEMPLFRRRFLQINRLTAIFSVALIAPIATLNAKIISTWVGSDRYGGDLLTWSTLGQSIMMTVLAFWIWPIVGIGKVASVLPIVLLGSSLNLILSVFGTYYFGIVGASIGTFTSYVAIYYTLIPFMLKREFDLSRREVIYEPIKALLLFIPVGITLLFLSNSFDFEDISIARIVQMSFWILIAGIACFIYLLLAWTLLLDLDERSDWKLRLQIICRRFKLNKA